MRRTTSDLRAATDRYRPQTDRYRPLQTADRPLQTATDRSDGASTDGTPRLLTADPWRSSGSSSTRSGGTQTFGGGMKWRYRGVGRAGSR